MSLYSEEVKKIIKSYDWPPGNRLVLDIVDEKNDVDETDVLCLRMYRLNFASFDGTEQVRIAAIMNDLIPRLISMGVPTRLHVAPGDGRVARV